MMKHIKLFEQFLNEAKLSKFVAFRVYSDWDYEHQMNSHMAQYAVPENIAKKLISKYKLNPDDLNLLKINTLAKLNQELVKGDYYVDDFGIDDLMPTYSIEPWDTSFSKATGLPLGDYTVVEVDDAP